MPTTTNMNLVLPTVSTTIGPVWASMLNTAMDVVDTHDHSTGKGVRITPSGLNISSDLEISGNNLTKLRTVRFNSQSTTMSGGTDVGCVYVYSGELYYRDTSGNNVAITTSGSVAGASGSITGLSSPASVVYSSGAAAYSFYSNTNAAAEVGCGDLRLYYKGTATNSLKHAVDSGITSWTITWPNSAPSSAAESAGNNLYPGMKISAAGLITLDALGFVPLGAIIPLSSITGSYTCSATTTADTFGFVLCGGQTISDGTSPLNGQVIPNLNTNQYITAANCAATALTPLAFTPSVNWGTSSATGEYWVTGIFMEGWFSVTLSGAGSGTFVWTLPNSWTTNQSSTTFLSGTGPTFYEVVTNPGDVCTFIDYSVPTLYADTKYVLKYGGGTGNINIAVNGSATSLTYGNTLQATNPFTWAINDQIYAKFRIPITQLVPTTTATKYIMRVK